MAGDSELLLLRLALLAIVLVFVLATALTLRSGLRSPVLRVSVEPRAAGARFVVLAPGTTGLPSGAEIPVAGEMSLGRDPNNGIVLGDSSVSGVHANIVRVAGGWRLVDLGSMNGTTLNGRPIDRRGVPLRGGERVALGAVVLRFDV
jgi:Inner membrane component of T3SS, cytoplasmic domain